MRPPDLVCVGHLVHEMIHRPDGVQGPFLGSPPAYCSVVAARQGTTTGLVTVVGPDMPEALLEPVVAAGVDTRGVCTGERTTASELIYDARGHKEIRYPRQARRIRPVDIPDVYRGCRLLYVCPMDNDVLPADLTEVAAHGEMGAVDLGGYGGVHMSLAHRSAASSLAALAEEVASHLEIVKASDEDVAAIYGPLGYEEAAVRLLARGPAIVLITLGARGVYLKTAQGARHVPALPTHVVDTTGGGDAFMAGFLSEYLRSRDPVRSACWGSATAALVVAGTGGVQLERMPVRAQIDEFVIRGYGAPYGF